MAAESLLDRAREVWGDRAGVPVSFRRPGEVVVAPASRRCPTAG